ncbi:triose-phosphate isomerase [Alloalcanivorax gelatiniphagus]|uniref:Triosephosphate isomerase n=1 Tax=Alloalcanivorax gelatiniphagus TaxID=1194167 RepID=A0ABY2XT00_9GAMM|nr:triose-phosphate isomerase [Alloalcanivorax gelatiniphagus]TMW15311.1 triose-phosphate isomerase [Alloalcanivorax gelatiniphagus]|tara:strand:- start:2574 stop:3323 length:750 start_codon:yes stop_codon:yes gene_type:complete
MTRAPLVAGNWKMNGRLAMVQELATALRPAVPERVEVALCPPYPYLPALGEALAGSALALGAQDLCDHEDGAFTGEVSAEMLLEFGCRFVIVGHSERREHYGEDDDQVASKFLRARQAGLTPILCLGESLRQREAEETDQVVVRQLMAVVEAAGVEALGHAVLAYEPVWAIGTGLTATPEQAQAVHAGLRAAVADHDADIAARLRILYGGSVKADNAAPLFAQPDIDGGLIGGASLKAEEFIAICRAAG